MTNILGIIIVGLVIWWAFASYDRMTKRTFNNRPPVSPCPHCGQVADAFGGDQRCKVCKRILIKSSGFGLKDKP